MSDDNNRHPRYHILGASSNLLGICFVLVTGLKITNRDFQTYADEICFAASFVLLASCLFSYLSIRNLDTKINYERIADYCFIFSLFSLFIAMITFMAGW